MQTLPRHLEDDAVPEALGVDEEVGRLHLGEEEFGGEVGHGDVLLEPLATQGGVRRLLVRGEMEYLSILAVLAHDRRPVRHLLAEQKEVEDVAIDLVHAGATALAPAARHRRREHRRELLSRHVASLLRGRRVIEASESMDPILPHTSNRNAQQQTRVTRRRCCCCCCCRRRR